MEMETTELSFPDVPPSMDNIPADKMSTYIGMELFRIFQASDNDGMKTISAFIVALGILGNVLLILMSVMCDNLRRKASIIECLRAVAETTILVCSLLLLWYDQYNVNGRNDQIVSAFAFFWLSVLASSHLCLLQAIRCFVTIISKNNSGSMLTSLPKFFVILTISCGLTLILSVISGIIYVANILAFMVIACLLYYVPFLVAFLLDVIKIFCVWGSSAHGDQSSDPSVRYLAAEDRDGVEVTQPLESMSSSSTMGKGIEEMVASFLASYLHTLAFAIATLYFVRIGIVFFKKDEYIVLESIIDLFYYM